MEGESAPPSPFQRSLRSLPPLLERFCVLRPRGNIPLEPFQEPEAGETVYGGFRGAGARVDILSKADR